MEKPWKTKWFMLFSGFSGAEGDFNGTQGWVFWRKPKDGSGSLMVNGLIKPRMAHGLVHGFLGLNVHECPFLPAAMYPQLTIPLTSRAGKASGGYSTWGVHVTCERITWGGTPHGLVPQITSGLAKLQRQVAMQSIHLIWLLFSPNKLV